MDAEPLAAALRESLDEPSRFGDFYRVHAETLIAHITREVYDLDTASDLAAETFARALAKSRTFIGTSDAEATSWLFKIADREVLQFRRRGAVERKALRRLGIPVLRPTEEEERRILDLAELDDLRAKVRAEFRGLSGDQQDALHLRVIDELAYEEVADRLGISQEAARARVARGLRGLAKAVTSYPSTLKEEAT